MPNLLQMPSVGIVGSRKVSAYGRSITDGCLGWEESSGLLDVLAAAVSKRRLKAEIEAE